MGWRVSNTGCSSTVHLAYIVTVEHFKAFADHTGLQNGIRVGIDRILDWEALNGAEMDEASEKLGAKIRDAQLQKIPYTLVVGDKEVEQKSVSPRKHGEGKEAELGTLSLQDFADRLAREAAIPF